MKRVLFLIHDLGYGGAEKVLVNLANNLDKSEYDVYIQTLFDVGVNKNYINDDVHYIPGWKRMFRGNVQLMKLFSPHALRRQVIKNDYDIVVSFLEGPCARIASAYEGKKVTWIHIEHLNTKALYYSFRGYDEMKRCYESFDKIVCVAKTVENNFRALSKVKNDFKVLYNVNESGLIIKQAEEKQGIISHSDECINIISVGRLIINHKGFDRLISIHKMLLDNGINNRVYILGEGEDKRALEDQIEKLKVKDSCFLLGFDKNPYKYIKSSDLFVCSSRKEGFSTAVTEALILGVPVVSTEVSGAKELLGDNNEYGIVCDNNEEALFDSVYKILSDKELLQYYKEQAVLRGSFFSTEKTTKAVEELLESL